MKKGCQGPDWSPTPEQVTTLLILFVGTMAILWQKGIANLIWILIR